MALNGWIPDSDLVQVQGSLRLASRTAAAWFALDAAAQAEDGVDLLISPDGAYRSFEDQTRLTGTGNHKYRPGYSIHGFGECVDINNWQRLGYVGHAPTWYSPRLDELAKRFGFRRTIWNEPWHYQHDGTTGGGSSGFVPDPETIELEDTDVDTILIEITDNNGKYGGGSNAKYFSLFTPSTGRVLKINDPALANQFTDRFGRRNADGSPSGAGYNCAYADWEKIHGGTYNPRA